jgi:hypothetical protein
MQMPGTFGNMGRNIFRGFGFYNWDASVGKSWSLSEKLKLQFRGEVFNVLNHPHFSTSSIQKNRFSSSFGVVRGTPDVWVPIRSSAPEGRATFNSAGN